MTMGNKFSPGSEDKLENALFLLASGLPLAEVLDEAGDDAEWLRPMLEMGARVGELREAIPIPGAEASLQRMLDYGQELAAATPSTGWQAMVMRLLAPRLVAGLAASLLVVILLGSAVTVLARRSLPGQPLYSLKRAGETLRLNLALDRADREQLLEEYNQRRHEEARRLLEQNRVAQLVYQGRVEAATAETLTIGDMVAQLTPQTKINGRLAAGAQVQVEVLTQPPDQLIAVTVTVLEPAPPTPMPPAPTLTPTPPPTATRARSQTTDTLKLPAATPTPVLSRATDVLTFPTATPTETPTLLPPPPPTTAPPDIITEPAPTAVSPPGDGAGNTNDNIEDGQAGDNTNSNEDNSNSGDSAPQDNTNDNDSSGGDNNSGPGGGEDSGSNDNSGSDGGGDSGGGDNSSSGGGDDSNSGKGGGDNSGDDKSGGDK